MPIYVDPVFPSAPPVTPLISPDGPTNVINYLGEANLPRSIRRQRQNNLSAMRRFGTPVIVKHMYNAEDVEDGIAEPSPNFSSIYKQARHNDPISHGVGYVSVEKATNEWVRTDGTLYVGSTPPTGAIPAPKYRGYGPGYLIYAILPDVSEDVFKLTETGAMIRVQQAQVQMGWFPEVNDNDLLIICELDRGENIVRTKERYLLKQTNPASMRGLDRYGRRESTEDFGNRFITDQSFEMTLIPPNDELMNVEVDR
jgi:hypothetical protein